MATMQKMQEKTGAWSAIFPNETVTETQSALFVKKLLAVSVSNITYLRAIFPEHAFGDRCLEDLNLKILRDDSSCPGACQVIKWVKGCFDALDKKYLKMLVVGIYVDVNDPDTVIESYTFKFSYAVDGGIDIYRNDKKISSAFNAAETKKATIRLLRTIVVLTQTLKSLPDDVMMTMKLLYYDDVTPSDYEPPGFKAAENDSFRFDEEPMNIKVGDVSTPFHSVKIRIKTDGKQFEMQEDPEDGVTEDKQSQDEESKRNELKDLVNEMEFEKEEPDQMDVYDFQNEPSELSVSADVPTESPGKPDSAVELASSQSQISQIAEEVEDFGVKCPCGCNEDDGLMILCAICKYWQHGVCFLVVDEDEAPEHHICDACGKGEEGKACTDPFLSSASASAVDVQATCLWRRALVACADMSRILPPHLARRLGVEMTVAQGLINRLEKEKFIKNPGKGKRLGKLVDKEKITKEGIPKYFKSQKDNGIHDEQEQSEKDQEVPEKSSQMSHVADEDVPEKSSERMHVTDEIENLAAKTKDMQLSRAKKKKRGNHTQDVSSEAQPVDEKYIVATTEIFCCLRSEDATRLKKEIDLKKIQKVVKQNIRQSPRTALQDDKKAGNESEKRGKKRAISNIDETAKFELCDSQDVDTDLPRKRKAKASVVSKAIMV